MARILSRRRCFRRACMMELARERGTGGGRCHDERAPARREGEERAPAEGEERAPARRSARLRARCARAWLPP